MKRVCLAVLIALGSCTVQPAFAQTITPGATYLPCLALPVRVDSVKSTYVYYRAVGSQAGAACRSTLTQFRSAFALVAVTLPPDTVVTPPDTIKPPPDTTTPPAGVFFRSDWSTALGNTVNAVQDGGRWPESYCGHDNVLTVVPGAPLGWTATPNVLQATQRGENFCWQIENQTAIPAGQDYYLRFFVFVDDEDQTHFHSVALNVMDPDGMPWGMEHPDATGYKPRLGFHGGRVPYPNHTWVVEQKLPRRQWFRFEMHVDVISTNPARYRLWPQIFDVAGNLVADASNYTRVDGGAGTLKQWYDGGATVPFTPDKLRAIAVGYEGSAGAPNTGKKWYYAAVAACSNWCGKK